MQELYDVERSFHCYPRRKLENVQIAQSNLCYGTHLTKTPKYEQEHEHAHSLSVLMRLSRYIYIYFLQFHFIVKEADTDTTVVPRGVVAAMKALREQKETSQGGDFLLMWCSQCCDLS